MHPQPTPSISPAHATLRPGKALTLEAPSSFGDVDWTLEHAPLDGRLKLGNLVGKRAVIKVPEFTDASGIYFLRAVSRQDPRLIATTTLRVVAPGVGAPVHPKGGLHKQPAPATGIGRLMGSLQSFLGIPNLPCRV